MAAPRETYAFIPPPPLPEFYLPEDKLKAMAKHDGKASATSSSPSVPPMAMVKAETTTPAASQQTGRHAATTDEVMYRSHRLSLSAAGPIFAVPSEASRRDTATVPPLAVYHICRLCLRPRSARYHREHPIPINGVPPPPGICRRCRIGPADEKLSDRQDTKEVVIQKESGDVKVGIKAFVPEVDYLTNEEMQDKNGRAILRSIGRRRLVHEEVESDRKDSAGMEREVLYRNVQVRQKSMSRSPSPLPRPATAVTSTSQDAIDAASKKLRQTTVSQPASTLVSNHAEITAPITRIRIEHSRGSGYHRLAKEIDSLTAQVAKPERTEAEIRRIAREEVEKYRQAERLVEAHPDAYARGRTVPVHRQLAAAPEVPVSIPWQEQPGVEEVRVVRAREYACPPPSPTPPTMREERTYYEEREKVVYPGQHSDTVPGPQWDEASGLTGQATHSEHRRVPTTTGSKQSGPTQKSGRSQAQSKRDWGPRWLQQGQVKSSVVSTSSDKTRWPEHDRPGSDVKHQVPVGNPWGALSDVQTGQQKHEQRQSQARPQGPAGSTKQGAQVHNVHQKAPDREYIYTVRTTTTTPKMTGADRTLKGQGDDEYYLREEHRYKRRSRVGTETTASRASDRGGKSKAQADVSEHGSSRVRFASKVEFSPTPPDSDASSAQFRQFGPQGHAYNPTGVQRGQVDGGAGDSQYEERRGRTLSRERGQPILTALAPSRQGFERQWDDSSDRTIDGKADPALNRPLAQALSESPSRERLNEIYGRPRSTDVEDGSNAPNQWTTGRRRQ